MKQLVQIVPALPPAMDGVGDYGLCLAHEFRVRHGVETVFICGNPTWLGPGAVDGFCAHAVGAVPERRFPALLCDLAPAGAVILLNFVGSGYDRNSCPHWLLRGLQDWKQRTPAGRLVTMYHESYSEGPPWTRSFWTNPFQRRICQHLARISDVVRTNVRIVQRRLEAMAPRHRGNITCTPVFSNVGEPVANRPYGTRAPWLVVFGSAGWRVRAFVEQADSLAGACRSLGIKKILNIGKPVSLPVGLPHEVESTGPLPAAEVSALMAQARAGYIAYPALWLGKSGIFAAYAAHGLLPVTGVNNSAAGAEIRAGQEYLTVDMLDRSEAELDDFSNRMHQWYRGHSTIQQATEYMRAFAAETTAVR